MILWLIGKSGAGKSTIAQLLYEELKPSHPNMVLLDGDILREIWGDQLGHTIEDRRINAQRISYLCKMLDQQGIHAIAAVLSIFPEWQRWNRDHFSSYYEIFLDASMETLRKRDSKGLYAKAESGKLKHVVGVDIPFPRPVNPDLTISPDEIAASPSEIAAKIVANLSDEFRCH